MKKRPAAREGARASRVPAGRARRRRRRAVDERHGALREGEPGAGVPHRHRVRALGPARCSRCRRRSFYKSCKLCQYMKMITLEGTRDALRDLGPEITIPEDVRVRAAARARTDARARRRDRRARQRPRRRRRRGLHRARRGAPGAARRDGRRPVRGRVGAARRARAPTTRSLDEAAARELVRAHTGEHDVYLEQLYTFGSPDRDPHARVVSVAYVGLVPPAGRLADAGRRTPSTRASTWCPAQRLPALAYDHARGRAHGRHAAAREAPLHEPGLRSCPRPSRCRRCRPCTRRFSAAASTGGTSGRSCSARDW